MPENPYTDLEIRIQAKTQHGYPIEIPLDGHQRFGGGYLPAEITPWVASATPEDEGTRLFEALLTDKTLSRAWERIRGQHPERRIRLNIDATAPELHAIPWERLYDIQSGSVPYPLAASEATPFTRYLASELPPGQPIAVRPISIAIAIASPDNLDDYNLTPIEPSAEQRIIQQATRDLPVDRHFIPQPCTLSAIEQAISDGCHILHFVGHGQFSKRLDQPQLYLADDENRVSLTTADDFIAMISRKLADLSHNSPLRLIYLSSCETATQSPDDAFRGLGQGLIGAGVPAVLAMQGKVSVETAQRFSSAFYPALLQHGQVDVASNAARATLMTEQRPDSALPVLYSRLVDNLLMAMPEAAEEMDATPGGTSRSGGGRHGGRSVVGSETGGDVITGDHNQTGGAQIDTVEGDISGQFAARDIVHKTVIEKQYVIQAPNDNPTAAIPGDLRTETPSLAGAVADPAPERFPIWQVPFDYNHDFTGRESYLDDLKARLSEQAAAAITQPQAIHGLGGIGKTQIALKYAYDQRDQYQVIWWLRAEEASTLATDFAALATALGLPQDPMQDQAAAIAAVTAWLKAADNWLLIFDNAPDQASIDPYLLQKGHTIITTRYDVWTNVAALPLGVMTRDEAIAFLTKATGQTDDAAAGQLAEALGDLPLALAQAAAYIKRHGRSYEAYLALFETHRTDLLARDFDDKAYPATVATTWRVSFEQIQTEDRHAFDLLYLLAYFVPDDIHTAYLTHIADDLPEELGALVQDALALDTTLRLLQQYALIEREGDQITIHRLVQVVSQDQLEATSLALTQETIATVLYQVSDYLNDQIKYAAAQAYAARDLAITEAVLGPEHPSTATSLNNLAGLLYSEGSYGEAKPLYERALAIYEAVLGPEHPHTKVVRGNLALLDG